MLNPELRAWVENFNTYLEGLRRNGFVPTPESSRLGLEMMTNSLVQQAPDIAHVVDHVISAGNEKVAVRIYHPHPESSLPVLIYLHGGGHMAGNVEVYDPICRKICAATSRIVVSVDYRLAPEYPYPKGLEDCELAMRGCCSMLEELTLPYSSELALAGDSAGGALSATLAHKLQNDISINISKLILIYPSLDYTMEGSTLDTYSKGYVLEKSSISYYFDQYLQNRENRKQVSPLFMEVSGDFPKTMVATAGFCPLLDEGNRYVEKLKNSGIDVQHVHFADMVHAFLNMDSLVQSSCNELYQAINNFLAT
jgi:acetyl esterase/lipase